MLEKLIDYREIGKKFHSRFQKYHLVRISISQLADRYRVTILLLYFHTCL